jgi:hypothetical protein
VLAWEAGERARAIRYYRLAVGRGDLDAHFNLGSILTLRRLSVDRKTGFKLLLKAAKEGHVDAMYKVGRCYFDGIGTRKSLPKTKGWMKAAIRGGSKEAKNFFSTFKTKRKPNQ